MKRSDGALGPELVFSPLERRLFAPAYRGKLRVARLYSRLARLHREPFAGIADVPSGRFLVDSRHPEDWAMLFGGMEESQLRWATSQVTRGSTAWDVGAHHGYYAVALARVVGAAGSVQAFEPFPESAEVVRRNVQLNRVSETVAVHPCAVGAAVGTGRLQLSENGPQNHSLVAALSFEGRTVEVPVTTIDAQVAALGTPHFIKLDVEGAELEALRGASRLLGLGQTTFLFESETWDPRRGDVHGVFRAFGYTLTSLARGREVPGVAGRMLVARPAPARR